MAASWTWTSSAEEQAFRAAEKESLSRTLLSLERYAMVNLTFLEPLAASFAGRRVSAHEIASKLMWTTKFTRDEARNLSWHLVAVLSNCNRRVKDAKSGRRMPEAVLRIGGAKSAGRHGLQKKPSNGSHEDANLEADPSMPTLMNAAEPVAANEAMPMPMDAAEARLADELDDANVDADLSMSMAMASAEPLMDDTLDEAHVDAKQAMPMPMASAQHAHTLMAGTASMDDDQTCMLAIMDAWQKMDEQKAPIVLLSFTDEDGVLQECLDDGTQRVAAVQPAGPQPGTASATATPKRKRTISKRPAAASPAKSDTSNKATESEARKVLGMAMQSEPNLQVLHVWRVHVRHYLSVSVSIPGSASLACSSLACS